MKVKVVKRCRKKWNEHNLMYICHKQCEIMHNIQRNRSNGQFLWAWMIQFFGENSFLAHFDQMNTPKCYTWLESYRSPLCYGKKIKLFFTLWSVRFLVTLRDILSTWDLRLKQSACSNNYYHLWFTNHKIFTLQTMSDQRTDYYLGTYIILGIGSLVIIQ